MKGVFANFTKQLRDSKVRAAYAFIALPLLLVTVFYWIPGVSTITLSFFKYEIVKPAEFVGLKNWIRFFQDEKVLNSLWATFIFMLGHVPIIVVCGLAVALVLNERWFKGRLFARTVYFLPLIVSTVAAAVVWNWLLDQGSCFGYAHCDLCEYLEECWFLPNHLSGSPSGYTFGVLRGRKDRWNESLDRILVHYASFPQVHHGLFHGDRSHWFVSDLRTGLHHDSGRTDGSDPGDRLPSLVDGFPTHEDGICVDDGSRCFSCNPLYHPHSAEALSGEVGELEELRCH